MKDPSAKVRLAAVMSLGRVGKGDSSKALLRLVSDSDRGVRQAALAALGSLGGKEQLGPILQQTLPAAETDAAVRQQAWEAVVAILARCDDQTVVGVADGLTDRGDAAEPRVKIMQMLVDRLRHAGSQQLPAAQRKLASALVKAGRPAEAAGLLGQTYTTFAATGSPDAPVVWVEWVDALLAADDPNCVTVVGSQMNAEAFAAAVAHLLARLDQLAAQDRHAAVVLLGTEAAGHLASRLNERQRAALQRAIKDAQARQLAADRLRVSRLVGQLCSTDEAVRKAAAEELQAMSDRAVLPLLEELKKAITAAEPDGQIEKAVLEVLRKVRPGMTGYDTHAPLADRVALIGAWMQDWLNRSP